MSEDPVKEGVLAFATILGAIGLAAAAITVCESEAGLLVLGWRRQAALASR